LFSVTGNLGPQLNIGGYNGASYGMWMQVKDAGNGGTLYPILLQPLGGNVGIGTTSPSQKLEVVGGEIKAGRVDSSSEGGQVSFGRASDNATGWYIDVYGNTSTPDLRFVDVSNSAVRMSITSGGNVGIGTTSPSYKLDVNGSIGTTGLYGKSYGQTSSSSTTSIIDTELYYSTFGLGSIYMISYGGNPNGGGSGFYLATYVAYIAITTGWNGSAVRTYISSNVVSTNNAPNIGGLTLSAALWNGSSEVTDIPVTDGSYQIRIKITGYNSSYVGSSQYCYLTRLS
jgi:hypothetical protein